MPGEKIRTWMSHYRLHGIDGLRSKRSAYIALFKLPVLSNQDREQLSSRPVVAIYDIRSPTKSWSGDAIKAACRRSRAGMENNPR